MDKNVHFFIEEIKNNIKSKKVFFIMSNEAIKTIEQLFETYKNDNYMKMRITQYICNRLPKIFETIKLTHITNQSYEEKMQMYQDTFIQSFLHLNKYFYIPTSEKFFTYDDEHYRSISEDDILYNVLTSISKNKDLLAWKKSTKISIMCKIKNNLLIKSIPNSETIQNILDLLYPSFFSSKSEAKYFLTIIGDSIFKKNNHLFHFIIPKAKSFLQELNNYSQIYIGGNILNTFKHKYYEHDYQNCRLIKISENIKNEQLWRTFIHNYFIDIICVACHYSIRYNSSDEYMLSNNDDLINYTFYLKQKNQNIIVDIFLNEYITYTSSGQQSSSQFSWKNILFLWKHFLDNQKLPFVVFQQNLKQIVIQKFANIYNETIDSFQGMYSKYMPSIQSFLHFWNDTMEICEDESDFEIEEIMMLFKRWTSENNNSLNNMNESQLLDLIVYYYPETEIENNKYIHKIKSSLWNKKQDINCALESFRNEYAVTTNISFYEIYDFYCKTWRNNTSLIVSKQYFEKYLLDNISEYIIDDSFISHEWLFS
jgi:hypothetical protein